MPTRLEVATAAAIDRDITAAGAILTRSDIRRLATNYNTSETTIYRHQARISSGRPLPRRTGGQRRVVTKEMDAAILRLLNMFPWFYLDEINAFLAEVFDIDVSKSTVWKALQRIKITRKKLRVEAAQRNAELRAEWQDILQHYEADQLIFVDESGSDERTGDRTYGWAGIGQRATVQRWFGRRERISVLPAYTIEGYIACKTFGGTCDAELFRDFILDDLLPLCRPFPYPRSVIVLDNASIHHTFRQEIEEACNRARVVLKFLPPYSPDFNPIEESF
jgi:transposase